jgi:hypothetical protein
MAATARISGSERQVDTQERIRFRRGAQEVSRRGAERHLGTPASGGDQSQNARQRTAQAAGARR